MGGKQDVWQGTLSLMVLRTLASMGPQHGFGIGRRIEDVSRQQLKLNYGTLYPMLVKLEQEGLIASEWRQSENNRRAKYYSLTAAGRRAVAKQAREWQQTADLMAVFLRLDPENA
jgi:transcriptional regulator